MCCFLEQETFTPQKVLVIPRNRWLRLNMTEKLFTGTLNHNQNKTNKTFIIVYSTDVKHIQRKKNRICYGAPNPYAKRILVDSFYSRFGEQDNYMRHCSAATVNSGLNCYWRSSSPSFSYGFLERDYPGYLYIEICPPSKS